MHPILIDFGFISLKSYGLMLATAILVGIYLARRQAEKEGVDPKEVESMAFWMVVLGVIGTRVLYTFVENASYYWQHPLEFFNFQSGGLSFIGGFLFAFAGGLLYCWKKKRSFWKMADIMIPSVALGNGIAKIGCFLAGCCHGRVCDLPWAITFSNPETLARPRGVPLHPAQLYETVWSTGVFLVLLWLRPRRKYYGELFVAFGLLFGVGRPIIESFRGEPRMFGWISIHQILALVIALISTVIWWLIRKKGISHPITTSPDSAQQTS